ncbi:MAG: hypothetical protein OJF52_002852 [Nitrospira sp.]|jgi:hypothetical protein|nr:MAG: hypothetical protein OJF52_002852 [Nitrospira sp.]
MNTKTQQFEAEFSKFPLKKRRFLERFAETGSISSASSHAGVSRRTHLKWKAKDKSFSVACEEALGIAIDSVEGEARRRAVEGTLEPVYHGGKAVGAVRRYSDVLLIFLLKALKPEKYRDSYDGGFSKTPHADREETLTEVHRKLSRLAAQPTAGHPAPPPHAG